MDFDTFYQRATTCPPFPWQRALAAAETPGQRLIRVPTGFGKTLGVVCAWLYHRVLRRDPAWPRRLLFTLPMRTLVEQTTLECQRVLTRLDLLWDPRGSHQGRVGLHTLLGGAEPDPFHLHPDADAVLIGTQDMLLSRALNRGYGAARARWPMDFGLFSQDALWVLDEVQLMGVGFATALQLAAFRQQEPSLRPCTTWSMSATLQRAWVQRSPDTRDLDASLSLHQLSAADAHLPQWQGSHKPIQVLAPAPGKPSAALAAQVASAHAALPGPHPFTLVVCNTVERACAVYADLKARHKGPGPELLLLHSRFRGQERARWQAALHGPPTARIIVATQVIEAGVDLSADLLFTELCPWSSLVQRLGRLARRGGRGDAYVLDLDDKLAAPYDADDLTATRAALGQLTDASPRALQAFEDAHPELLAELYRFEPRHLLLREEITELFDTTADLSGGDLDVSRFIREGDERDLQLAWIPIARDDAGRPLLPPAALHPGREALCAVSFLRARDWLCGKKSGGVEPQRLRPGVAAYVWDYLDGAFRAVERKDLRPGAIILVDAAAGGYSLERGFDPESKDKVPPVPLVELGPQERADAAQDQEDLSFARYQTIAFHGGAVAARAAACLQRLTLAAEPLARLALTPGRLAELLHLAGRWHDLGKAHPAFQGAIRPVPGRPARQDLAKAPAPAWRKGRPLYQSPPESAALPQKRPGLRHELASLLALFDVLSRHAPPAHPARLGDLAEAVTAAPPRAADTPPTALEAEILALAADEFDLVAYLVCAHHGKLRARLHAAPCDQDQPLRDGSLPIRGVYEGDVLPAVELCDARGGRQPLPPSRLSLQPAALGLSPGTGRSWTERALDLRSRFGPFALAYLEALLRAADVRASMDDALVDPALAQEVTP